MTTDLHPDTGQPRPGTCCGQCPPIAGGGWDCTCEGNPRCRAAGRPRVGDTITTVEQLDVLRPGTVALDRHGSPWRKGTGSWVSTSDGGVIEPHEAAPLTVLYVPGEQPRLSVTDEASAETMQATVAIMQALYDAVTTIKQTRGAVEIHGVRIEPCDEYRQTETTRALDRAAGRAETTTEDTRGEAASAWSDYRKDYGVSLDGATRAREHAAFLAGFKAGREGDQSGALR